MIATEPPSSEPTGRTIIALAGRRPDHVDSTSDSDDDTIPSGAHSNEVGWPDPGGWISRHLINQMSEDSSSRDCLLIGPSEDVDQLRRVARYVNSSLRSSQVDVLALPASPFRLAMLATVVQREGPPEATASRDILALWLTALVDASLSMVFSRDVSRFRRLEPKPLDRLCPLRRSSDKIYFGTDETPVRRLPVDAVPVEEALDERVPSPRRALVAGAPGPDRDMLLPIFESFTVQPTADDPTWREWWGTSRSLQEVAVIPADIRCVGNAVSRLRNRAWRCPWCGKLQIEADVCGRCGADNRRPDRTTQARVGEGRAAVASGDHKTTDS